MNNECEKCKFWKSWFDEIYETEDAEEVSNEECSDRSEIKRIGMCRINPPAFIGAEYDCALGIYGVDGNAADYFRQPITKSYDWCGQFKPRTNKSKAK